VIYDTLLLDAPYLSHRSFALHNRLTTSTGLDSTLIHNFIRSLGPLKRKFPDAKFEFAWESYGTSQWRRELYPSYKPPRFVNDGYKEQVRDLQRLLSNLGYKQYYSPGNEADDVIARLCQMSEGNTCIFTVDKDLMQLINHSVHMYNGKELFESNDVKNRYLVDPLQIPDLLAIWGDVSDNIEGIESFGLKKSAEVINKFGDIEHIPENHSLRKQYAKIELNKKITTLNSNCPLVDYKPLPFASTNDIITKYELKSIGENIENYRSEYDGTRQTTFV
jgi:DNA polymerase I